MRFWWEFDVVGEETLLMRVRLERSKCNSLGVADECEIEKLKVS